ncbi:MAG: LPS assembly lipoprotein LptE [Spirochaetota bacterium]
MKSSRKVIEYACLFFIVAMAGSCSTGESVRDSGMVSKIASEMNGEPVIPRVANKICVPAFRNITSMKGIEKYLSREIRKSINIDGRLVVVDSNNGPQLLLSGTVTEYQLQDIKFDEFGTAVKKRLRIVAQVSLSEVTKEKVIFRNKSVQAFRSFSDIQPPITSELAVRTEVLNQLAERIKVQTIRGWYTELQTAIERVKKK